MHPYSTIRLTEFPDVGDMRREARASRVGMLSRHTVNHRSRVKRSLRRTIKRSDRARDLRARLADEAAVERALWIELEEIMRDFGEC